MAIYNTGTYPSGIVKMVDGTSYSTNTYDVIIVPTLVNNGSGINLDITVTNLTTGNQPALRVDLDAGWGNITGTAPVDSMWFSDPSFKFHTVGTGSANYIASRPYIYDGANYGVFSISSGLSLANPLLVIGNSGKMIGFATNDSHQNTLNCINISGNYGFQQMGGYTQWTGATVTGAFVFSGPIDHFSSGEVRNWQIYLRTVSPSVGSSFGSGSVTGALETVQPYIDWYTTNYPDNRPPKIKGRILALMLAINGAGSGSRDYIVVSGVTPDSSGQDWNSLFRVQLPEPRILRSLGFNTVLIWNIAGVASGPYIPSIWDNLPDNLKSTTHQIDEWSRANKIDIGFWVGSAYGYYQTGNFNSTLLSTEPAIGNLGSTYNIATASGRYIIPEALTYSRRNIENGAMIHGKIVGFDGGPSFARSPWFMDVASGIRTERPNKMVFTENYHADLGQNYIPTTYYPHTQWDQQRCPLMDQLIPNYQNFIIINNFDFSAGQRPSGAMNMVYLAESMGICPIIFYDYFITSMNPPSSLNESSEDNFSQYDPSNIGWR